MRPTRLTGWTLRLPSRLWFIPGRLSIPDQVSLGAPPAFIVIANDDAGHMDAVLSLVEKYHAAKRPMEVHIFERGGHGFGMGARFKAGLRSLMATTLDRLVER